MHVIAILLIPAVLGCWLAPAHAAPGAAEARLIPSREPGWPQWRGPYRDGLVRETGLLPQWPEGGPKVLWEINSIGRGYSSPILTPTQLFITGDRGEDLIIYAFDHQGRPLWQATNGACWKDPYPGARASAAYAGGHIYHLNAHGRLACLAAASGHEVWAVNIIERFKARNITWALSECLLVDEQYVYVTAGGDLALMAALDRRTGATRWTSPPLRLPATGETPPTADRASYASPILFELAGRRHLVNCSQTHAFGVDAESGALLWTYPMPTTYKVLAATPVVHGDTVFITGPDGPGGALLRIHDQKNQVNASPLWISKLDTCHGGLVVVNDLLIGSWYRGRRGWACLDIKTGNLLHQTNVLNKGSVIFAEDRLYILTEDGHMALLRPDRERFEILGQFRFAEKHKNDVWAHPVIFQGRLYLRYHERLVCFDVRRRPE